MIGIFSRFQFKYLMILNDDVIFELLQMLKILLQSCILARVTRKFVSFFILMTRTLRELKRESKVKKNAEKTLN